jgi:Holliday junction resolvasome RuvABC DNA-binding subunit
MSEIDDLRAELEARDQRLTEQIETLRAQQRPSAAQHAAEARRLMSSGYEQSTAERAAKKAAKQEGEA